MSFDAVFSAHKYNNIVMQKKILSEQQYDKLAILWLEQRQKALSQTLALSSGILTAVKRTLAEKLRDYDRK
jgi:hypothetical protein